MNRQIEIAKATHAELLTFARNTLGLNLAPKDTKRDTLIAKIGAAWVKDYILVPEAEAEVSQAGQAPQPQTAEQQEPDREMVRIHIHTTEEAGGNEPVSVGVNGKVMRIPRGEDVDIPYTYYEVLKHAIAKKYDPLPDGGMSEAREVPMYPFQVISGLKEAIRAAEDAARKESVALAQAEVDKARQKAPVVAAA